METLSTVLFGSPPLQNHPKTQKPFTRKPISHLPNFLPICVSINSDITHSNSSLNSHLSPESPSLFQTLAKTITLTAISTSTAFYTLPCFASEPVAEQVTSDKINLETIVVSIDDFFKTYPFFIAGCAFIWLVVTPVAKYYLSKSKYIYSIDAYKKLRDDPNAQLLDIRDAMALKYLQSPNLKLFGKNVVQVQFSEDDTDGFVKKVLANFSDPGNTIICILDNLDGNSMKAAELLFKSGFKEAYAIKGGVAGKRGWLEIQESLLPASLHVLPGKKKSKKSQKLRGTNGGLTRSDNKNTGIGESQEIENADSTKSMLDRKITARSSSPYPNYPDLKPPSSPTPSKPSK